MKTTEYNDLYAQNYDDITGGIEGAQPTVEMLSQVFEGARTLIDIGIGTGRIAIPLSQRGYSIRGVDISPAMIDKLNTKIQCMAEKEGVFPSISSQILDLSHHCSNFNEATLFSEGAYASLGSLCCIHEDTKLLTALRRIHDLVAPGSKLAIEAYSPLFFRTNVPSTGLTTTLPLPDQGKAISKTTLDVLGVTARVDTEVYRPNDDEKSGFFNEMITLRSPEQYAIMLENSGWRVLTWDPEDSNRGLYWILAESLKRG